MNPVAIFDLISFLAALTSLIILFAFWKRVLPLDAKFLLVGLFILIGFHSLSNVLEWSGITAVLDPFEDYIEMLEPLFLGFFIYAFLQENMVQNIRENEEKFRLAFENANSGMCLVDLDGCLIKVNNQMSKIFGYSQEELESMTVNDIAHPEDRNTSPEFIKRALSEEVDGATFNKRYFNKKGHLVWGQVSSSLVRDSQGAPLYFISQVQDITERKRVGEEIKQRTEDLSLINLLNTAVNRGESYQEIINLLFRETKRIFSSLGASVYFLSEDKEYLILQNFVLPQTIFRGVEKIIGIKMPEVKIRLKKGSLYSQVLRSKTPRLFNDRKSIESLIADCTENKILKKLATKIYKFLSIDSVIAVPLVSDDDILGLMDISRKEPFVELDLQRFEVISEQITTIFKRKLAEEELKKYREHLEEMVRERTAQIEESQRALVNIVEDLNATSGELKDANEQLEELDQLKSMFIASMSHELRTPLNSIMGFTGIILQGMVGEVAEEQRKQLTMVKNSASHLLSLINDIIDISKIEAGKLELNIKKFDMPTLVKEVKDSFAIAIVEKGLEISLIAPNKVTVESDERRVKQVLVNLVSNAVKFTDEGKIEIRVVKKDKDVEMSVEDTGIGIKREDMDRLFKAFSQIFVEGQPKQEGTGLGLYLSKKIANLLGGDIKTKSEYGKRSVFTFFLPLRYQEAKER